MKNFQIKDLSQTLNSTNGLGNDVQNVLEKSFRSNLELSKQHSATKSPRGKSVNPIKSLNDSLKLILSQSQQQNPQQYKDQGLTNHHISKISFAENFENEEDYFCEDGFEKSRNLTNESADQVYLTAVGQIRTIQRFSRRLSAVFNKKTELECLMQQFDDKVVETINKKEYELLKSFQITLDKMTKELQFCQQKLNDFNLQVELDVKIIGLEKQLRFFRENCYSLNEDNKQLKEENTKLKHLYNELEQENLWSRKAHLKTQQKLNVMIQSNENLNATKQSYTQKNFTLQNYQEIPQLNEDQEKESIENNEFQKTSKLSRQYRYRDSLNAAKHVIYLQENLHQAANVIDQLLIDKINPRDQLIEQLKEQLNNQKQLNKSLSLQLKTNNITEPNENLIKQLFLKAKHILIYSSTNQGVYDVQQEIIKRNKMNNNTLNSNIDQLEVQKFTKFDRIEIMQKFFSSQKFLELIKSMVFDEKCCQNPKCKFNILTKVNEDINSTINVQQTKDNVQSCGDIQKEYSSNLDINSTLNPEVTHQDYLSIVHNQQEKNTDTTNINKQSQSLPANQEKNQKLGETIDQLNSQNRLYQIKQRQNISFYHSSQNSSRNQNYKKTRSNSQSYTHSAYQHGFSDGQSTNINSFRDNTFRSNANHMSNQTNQVLEESLDNTWREKSDKGNREALQQQPNSSNSYILQQNGYHKLLKYNYSKQKQNYEEINNMHRKFHKFNKDDKKKPQMESQITNLINTLTQKQKSNSNNQFSQTIDSFNASNQGEKENRFIFKNNKVY